VLSTRGTVIVIDPFALHGRHVDLVPLAPEHAAELAAAATGDRATYRYTEVPTSPEHAADYISRLLAQREAGAALPFAQRRTADGRLVGCTRFMELRRWRGREEPDEVEIGGTWLAPDAQRSPINTEAKLLLLVHAFDVWGVTRVALATDVRNERSRRAIERIGATFEGVLRHHRPSHAPGEGGRARDTALFAITDEDWPLVRANLVRRLASRTVPT
jgi:N-acetyltransferase